MSLDRGLTLTPRRPRPLRTPPCHEAHEHEQQDKADRSHCDDKRPVNHSSPLSRAASASRPRSPKSFRAPGERYFPASWLVRNSRPCSVKWTRIAPHSMNLSLLKRAISALRSRAMTAPPLAILRNVCISLVDMRITRPDLTRTLILTSSVTAAPGSALMLF
jgi:hypothetical protein